MKYTCIVAIRKTGTIKVMKSLKYFQPDATKNINMLPDIVLLLFIEKI